MDSKDSNDDLPHRRLWVSIVMSLNGMRAAALKNPSATEKRRLLSCEREFSHRHCSCIGSRRALYRIGW